MVTFLTLANIYIYIDYYYTYTYIHTNKERKRKKKRRRRMKTTTSLTLDSETHRKAIAIWGRGSLSGMIEVYLKTLINNHTPKDEIERYKIEAAAHKAQLAALEAEISRLKTVQGEESGRTKWV